jgi:predicted component of type VI protein secretion system
MKPPLIVGDCLLKGLKLNMIDALLSARNEMEELQRKINDDNYLFRDLTQIYADEIIEKLKSRIEIISETADYLFRLED